MRISDWSSDVCSSDLLDQIPRHGNFRNGPLHVPPSRATARCLVAKHERPVQRQRDPDVRRTNLPLPLFRTGIGNKGSRPGTENARAQAVVAKLQRRYRADRKSVVQGKSVSVRLDLGGRRIIKTKKK